MSRDYTTVSVKKDTLERLKSRKGTGQSIDGYIQELLDQTKGENQE